MNDDRSTEKHCGSLVVLLLYGVNTENVTNGVNAGRVKRDGMPIKSLLSKIIFPLKLEFARQRNIHDLLQTFIVHYIKKR